MTLFQVFRLALALMLVLAGGRATAIPTQLEPTYLLPLNCSELLPDNSTFVSYFDSVGKGQVVSDKALSQKIFRILALRERVQDTPGLFDGANPVDVVIRRTLCYYRQQKDALRPVPYYDSHFLSFLKENIKDLEKKVEAVILECQYKLLSRELLEKRAKKNQALVESEKKQAEKTAAQIFERLNQQATRKAKYQ
ncbi:hypothetical protein EBT16_05660 [bacterium]|nr:hypothetical protein [bacterium]